MRERITDGGAAGDRSFEDPEFATVAVPLTVDDVREEISDAVKGLHATESDVGTKIRTTDGMLVAVIQTGPAGDDAVVHYRIEPPSEQATRKGRKLGRILESFEIDAESSD